MSYPMLQYGDVWYKSKTVAETAITTINIVDIADELIISSAMESWPAAVDANGDKELDNDIMCYLNGTILTIAGNGSGKIYAHRNSDGAFYNFSALTAINGIELLDTSQVKQMRMMFYACKKLTTLNISNWNTAQVSDFAFMFGYCEALTTLNISNWNTAQVLDFSAMFQYCKALTGLDVSQWDTSNVTSMKFMFYACTSLKTLDVSNWNTAKVKTFDHMFAHSYLSGIDVSKWDTSSATNMYAMFHTIQNTTIDVSNFNTSKVKAFGQMFEYMSQLIEIKGLNRFDTSTSVDFDEMFNGCEKLQCLDLSSFDTRKATFNSVTISNNGSQALSTVDMFKDMRRLQKITLGENFTFAGDGTTKSGYSYGALPTPNQSYIAGADGNWYTERRTPYLAADIPNNTAMTYYASIDLVNDVDCLVKNGTMFAIADAIRSINGTTDVISPSDMPTQIINNQSFETGKQAECDAFWDDYQNYGNATYYPYRFSGQGWTNRNFKPKYDIKPKGNCNGMFREMGVINIRDCLINCGVTLDLSGGTGTFTGSFAYGKITELPKLDFSGGTTLQQTFSSSTRLVIIEEMVVHENLQYSSTFSNCTSLDHLIVTGVIGQNGFDVSACPLDHDSLMSIINSLKSGVSSMTVALGSANLEKLTAEEKQIATDKGWTLA